MLFIWSCPLVQSEDRQASLSDKATRLLSLKDRALAIEGCAGAAPTPPVNFGMKCSLLLFFFLDNKKNKR